MTGNGLSAEVAGLQQGAHPEERQGLAVQTETAAQASRIDFIGRQPAHRLDQRRRHAQVERAATHHHHLRDGGGQRQHQLEAGTVSCVGRCFDAATDGTDLRAHDIHANAATGQLGHLVDSGKTGAVDQLGQFAIAGRLTLGDQPADAGLVSNARQVQTLAVIAHLDADLVARLADRDDHPPRRILAGRSAHRRQFDAVGDAVAQQMLEGAGHSIEHASVDLDRAAFDVQPHLLAGFLGGLTHHALQPFGHTLELDHARSQQIVLQLAGEAALRRQFVLGTLQRFLQSALYSGHVVDRLGEHSGEFLQPRVAIELERVKLFGRRTGGLHARADLRVGLDLDFMQLTAQAVEVVAQVAERVLHLIDVGGNARAGDAHLASLVDQPVEQRRAHTHGRGRWRDHRHGRRLCAHAVTHEGRPVDVGQRCRFDFLRGRTRRLGGLDRHQRRSRRHGRRALLGHFTSQRFEDLPQAVTTREQRLDVGTDHGSLGQRRGEIFYAAFQAVQHLAEPHRTGQPRGALERVQIAHGTCRLLSIGGGARPALQMTLELVEQFVGFFLEDREQFWLDRICRIGLVLRQKFWHRRLDHRGRFNGRLGAGHLQGWLDLVHCFEPRGIVRKQGVRVTHRERRFQPLCRGDFVLGQPTQQFF